VSHAGQVPPGICDPMDSERPGLGGRYRFGAIRAARAPGVAHCSNPSPGVDQRVGPEVTSGLAALELLSIAHSVSAPSDGPSSREKGDQWPSPGSLGAGMLQNHEHPLQFNSG